MTAFDLFQRATCEIAGGARAAAIEIDDTTWAELAQAEDKLP